MTREYTGFPISNFRVGFDEALEPWLLPRDAFQVVKNAHLYRGVIEKISGYTLYARMSYSQVVGLIGSIDGVNKTFTGTLNPLPTTNSLTVRSAIGVGLSETFADDGFGNLSGSNGGSGSIDYVTGVISVTFGTDAPIDMTVNGIQYNAVYVTYQSAVNSPQPIMGIKQYISPNGSQEILIFDSRRLGKVVVLNGDMASLEESDYGIVEVPHEIQSLGIVSGFNDTTGPFTGIVMAPLTPGMVSFQVFDSSNPTASLLIQIVDDGSGNLIGTEVSPGSGTATGNINYLTGQWTLTFSVNRPSTSQMNFSGCIYGDAFTGNFTNFFTVANYQGKIFFTNNIDPPMYYDGNCVKYLNTNLTSKPNTVAPYDISRALHLALNRERLILMSVVVQGEPQLNTNYWSEAQNPLNFTNNEFLAATTSEPIRAFSFINTDLVVKFSNSERVFRYTGDPFSPFRWDSTNNMWRCDATHSTINYDSWFSAVGRPAIVGSDAVNVRRADEIIPDFTFNQRIGDSQPVLSIDQGSISQCYGERFDDFKEGWLCYRSYQADDLQGVKPSNNVLAFSYLDNTYAIYTFPFSCLGFGRIITEDVWANNFDYWEEANYAWNSYTESEGALIDLAGDQNGNVFKLGTGNSITNTEGNVIPCLFELITKDFNPFVEGGQLARLGHVDFLVSSNSDTKIRVQFYKDNELDTNFNTYYQESELFLNNTKQSKIWKRIYVGAVGKSHTFRIYQAEQDFDEETLDQPVRIHAIVPYFKAAGRIFN